MFLVAPLPVGCSEMMERARMPSGTGTATECWSEERLKHGSPIHTGPTSEGSGSLPAPRPANVVLDTNHDGSGCDDSSKISSKNVTDWTSGAAVAICREAELVLSRGGVI